MKRWRIVICAAIVIILAGIGLCHAQEAKTFPVSGKVLMPDGSPATGATVEARNIGHRTDWMVKATATSNAEGEFTMQLERGSFRFCAVSEEYVYLDESEMIDVAAGGALSKPIEMRLVKGCKVEGSVVDTSNGKPVGGVKIITRDGDHAESSDSGEWSMVVRKRDQAVIAMKEGCWWPVVNFDASGDTVKVKVEIKPGGTIKGRVVDEQGQPVADVRVSTPMTYFRMQRTNADADGRFTLGGQDMDSKVQVSASADGYEYLRDQAVMFSAGQQEVEIELKLTKIKVRTISGRVTQEDGSPVEGVKVAYGHGTSYWNYVTAKTDKDGRYTIKDARIAECVLVASQPGLAPEYKVVEADKDAQVDFVMKPGHTVEGRVEDEDGNPLEGVRLSVSMEVDWKELRGNLYGTIFETTTDKDGCFKLGRLPEGFVYVNVYAAGFDRLDNERLKVDRKDYTLVLRKTVPGQICGTVVKESDGKPVTEFNVRLDFSRNGGRSSGLSTRLYEQGVSFQGTDGRFSIKDLTVNDGYRVVVTVPGYMQGSADPVMVKPLSEEAYEEVVVRLRPASPFEGSVAEAGTGSPVDGVLVTVWNAGSSSGSFRWDMSSTSLKGVSTRTGVDGNFRFDSMPFSLGMIMLEKPGFARTMLKNVKLSQPVQVSMEKGATITGSIADEQGKVPQGVWLSLRLSDLNLDFRTQINPDGSFKVEDLPSGEYMITQHKEGRSTKYQAFELKAGETYQVDWDKQGAVVVEGKVLQNGKPVTNAKINVNIRKSGMNWAGSAETSADGSYKLSLFKPGSYSFSCQVGDWMDPNKMYTARTLQLATGANRVDFSLPCGSVSGKLVNKLTGKPLVSASVRLYVRETYEQQMGRKSLYFAEAEPWWWPRNECKTDKNGVFQAKNLKAGEWLISVMAPAGIPAAVVKLAEGEAKTGVVAKVPPTGSAKINIAGMKSLPKDARIVCTDEYGFTHYPKYDKDGYSTEFPNLPVGKMIVIVECKNYLPAQVSFQVKSNETVNVPVKLMTGPKIVFKPKGGLADPNGTVSVAFRITTPDGKPVLQRSSGLCWGSVVSGSPADPASIMVKPGTYILKATMRSNDNSWGDESDLTGWSGTIKVAAGKDTVIEIPLEQ